MLHLPVQQKEQVELPFPGSLGSTLHGATVPESELEEALPKRPIVPGSKML